MNKKIFTLLLIILNGTVYSQKMKIDELKSTNDENLLVIFSNNINDISYAEKVIGVYIERAKALNDTVKIARGFDRMTWLYSPKQNLIYVDSIIHYTKNLKNKTYPGLGFLLKGHELYNLRRYKESLDSFLKAHEYAIENNNHIQLIYLEKRIISILNLWGDKKEAINKSIALINKIQNLDYFSVLKSNGRKSLLINDSVINYYKSIDIIESNQSLVTSLLLNGDFVKANNTNENLLNYVRNNELKEYLNDVIYRKAEIDFYRGNYASSLDSLKKYKNYNNNASTILNSQYYIGLNYIALDSISKGIDALLTADSIFDLKKFIYPSQRKLFEELYKYFISQNIAYKELEYLNKLIFVDSIFKSNYSQIEPFVVRNFETPVLLAEKQELINQLEWQNGKQKRQNIIISFFLFLSAGSSVFYFNKQKQYKKRFNLLLEQGLSLPKEASKADNTGGISAKVIEQILCKVEQFEQAEGYLSQDVSLQSVAKKFNTNSSYLSKVINLKKDRNFSQYINELRIEYAVNELKRNARFRKYTIRAIAEEVGFGNSQSFSKAFYKRTGLQPSYFVRNLNKRLSQEDN